MLTGYARMHGDGLPIPPRWALLIHVDQRDVVGSVHVTTMKLGALWTLITAPLFLLTIWATAQPAANGPRAATRRASHRARRAADGERDTHARRADHAAEGIDRRRERQDRILQRRGRAHVRLVA
jgi:hypothetical protein